MVSAELQQNPCVVLGNTEEEESIEDEESTEDEPHDTIESTQNGKVT